MSRHIPIAEIVAALYRGSSDPIKAVAMVEALESYFDDSGTHGESLVTTISGFMAPAKTWECLETEWQNALSEYKSRYGVTWYHATDIANRQKEWRAVPLDVCGIAPMQFAAILAKQNLLPIWAAVVNDQFYSYATREFLDSFPTPFDLCFHEAMGQLYHWCKGELKAPRVIPFVAHGNYTERITKAHARYREDGDFSEYIGPLAIDSPKELIPLQASDLLAYEFYQWWVETEYPTQPDRLRERPALYRAIERNQSAMRGVCFSGEGFKTFIARHTDKKRQGGR